MCFLIFLFAFLLIYPKSLFVKFLVFQKNTLFLRKMIFLIFCSHLINKNNIASSYSLVIITSSNETKSFDSA